MTILYIRHPARALGSLAACQYALAGEGGALMQHGTLDLPQLADSIASARRVVLIVAACDVSLLRLQVPPLTGARLKAALPNLVEDHVLGDPADCVLAAGPADEDGKRTVAVAQRGWLEDLAQRLITQGARQISILPGQLCLPLGAAAISHGELALRTDTNSGAGLALEGAPDAMLGALHALGCDPATSPVYVPAPEVEAYRALGAQAEADNWSVWIHSAADCFIDLAPALGSAGSAQFDWKRWRWPLALAAAAVLVNAVALNIEWLRLRREADAVRQSMFQTFHSAYPKAADPLYPAEQLRRNVAMARANSGQMSPTDFGWQSSAIGEVLAGMGQKPEVIGLEYKDSALTVKVKPETLKPGMLDQVRNQLALRGLVVSEMGPGVWTLRVKEGKA